MLLDLESLDLEPKIRNFFLTHKFSGFGHGFQYFQFDFKNAKLDQKDHLHVSSH